MPITEVTDLHVLTIINAKKRTAPVQARNDLGNIKRLFTWAIDQRVYGLKTSPCDGLKAAKIIGEKKSGDRILSDAELFAFWRADFVVFCFAKPGDAQAFAAGFGGERLPTDSQEWP